MMLIWILCAFRLLLKKKATSVMTSAWVLLQESDVKRKHFVEKYGFILSKLSLLFLINAMHGAQFFTPRSKIRLVKGGRALHIALGLRAKEGILLDYWQWAAGWGWEWKWSGYRALAFSAAVSQEGSYCRSARGLQRRSVWGRPRRSTHMDESWLTSLGRSSLYSLGHSLSLTAEIFSSTCWIKTAAAVDPLGVCWCWKRRAQWLGWVFYPHVGPLELPCTLHLLCFMH